MIEGITLEQLRTLQAVAEAGSFSAAARKLGRVQAAVSQAIERLEAQTGLRLFDRSGRVPRLTQHGEALVAAGARTLSDMDALSELVASLKRGVETRLSIIVDAMFPASSLVAFAHDFAKEHPCVELVLFTDLLSAVTAHVRARRSTWGIALEDADFEGLDHRPIADVRLLPVAAKGHPYAALKGPIDAAKLADGVQIVLGGHAKDSELDPSRGVFSPRTWRVVDLATKQALLLGGLGWGHMPEHLVRDDLKRGKLVELRLDAWGGSAPRRALELVWRRGVVMGPIARWAQDHLSKLCQAAVSGPPS